MEDKDDWIKYDGNYDKAHYSILTKNGYKYFKCWPNAGNFHADNGLEILGENVAFIKKLPTNW